MTRKVGRIRDVARETGLSTATISRVMNGAKNVSPQTRQRVLDACSRLDYLPNPAARALSTARSRTIAAIIPTIEHSIYAKYIAAIEQTLAEHDYSLVLAISGANTENEVQAARKLLGMGAQAFILIGADHSDALAELFVRRQVPHVLTSIWAPESTVPVIGYDNHALAARAVEYLADKGHRDIAVLHGPLAQSDRTRARRDGARAAAQAPDRSEPNGSEPHRPDLSLSFVETSLDVEGGRAAIDRVLGQPNRATAVLCFSDVLALGCYFGLQDAGLSVPSDLSVMGFDNLDWSATVVPGLTTIDLPARQMGETVAAQLVSTLEHRTQIPRIHLDGTIVERGSVSTPRG